jgi:hypothetical protein
VTDHPLRPATRRRLGRPPPHQQADRPRAQPQPNPTQRQSPFHPPACTRKSYPVLDPVSQAYPKVKGRLLTCYSPVRRSSTPEGAFPHDLHVLSTPPAFVLSQDQTLQQGTTNNPNTPTPTHTRQDKRAPEPPAKPEKRAKIPTTPPPQPNRPRAEASKNQRNPSPQTPQQKTIMEPTATRTRHYGSFKHAVEFSKNGHPPTKPAGLDGVARLTYQSRSLSLTNF